VCEWGVSSGFFGGRLKVGEKDQDDDWQDDPSEDDGPSRRAALGVDIEQAQAGEGKDHASDREDIHVPAPRGAGVAAFVQVVEVGDPATAGDFVHDVAGLAVDSHPRVAARAGEVDIDFFGRPLKGASADIDAELLVEPVTERCGERFFHVVALLVAVRDCREEFRGNRRSALSDLRLGGDLVGVVERHAGEGEDEH